MVDSVWPQLVGLFLFLHYHCRQAVPGAAALVSTSGPPLPIASRLDDAELRKDVPGLLRIPLAEGIAETAALYRALEAAGKLTV